MSEVPSEDDELEQLAREIFRLASSKSAGFYKRAKDQLETPGIEPAIFTDVIIRSEELVRDALLELAEAASKKEED